MMMSFAEAAEYINPAYNPNLDSFFPQPVLNSDAPIADSSVTSSNDGSLTVATERFSCNTTTNQQHAVELCKKKTVKALRCEICSVSCNSISVLEKHIMGKKHRKKTGEQSPEALMLDSVKSEECMEGVEITSVKNYGKDAIPGAALEEMSTATHISCGTQTMPDVSGKRSDGVSEIHIAKHQGFSTSVADNTCNKKGVNDDEIMADKRQSTQFKSDNSVDLNQLDSASGSTVRVCAVGKALRCEICSVSCNSISVLEKHLVGKKHRKKTEEQSPEALMLDSVKSDECMEGVEIASVKNYCKDAIPGAALEEMSTATHISCGTDVSGKRSDGVSKIHIAKHQGFSASVADNTCNKKDVNDDEIMLDKRQSTQLKPDNSVDLNHLDSASGSTVRVCAVCNIFSNSQAELEKHLAGKPHARKVKYLGTLMSSPVTVYPRSESHTIKLTCDTSLEADSASFVPIGCPKIQVNIHSESGCVISSENGTVNVILSPKVCTICSIKCNSQEIFQAHLSGRKHASKVRMLGSSVHAPSTKDQGAPERASKKGKVVQFVYCDVCKIYCNSSEILDAHIMGKKHMKQLEKFGK